MRYLCGIVIIMNRFILILALMILVPAVVFAQKKDKKADKKSEERELYLTAYVKDHLTHNGIREVKGQLLWARDSSFIDTLMVDTASWDKNVYSSVACKVKQPGKYLLKLYAMGYRASYVPVEVEKMYKSERYRSLKTIYMRTLPKDLSFDLDEVEIKATKLKFYMDGDTLVYDASAFSLSEGSMLSELVKKLPGVELKKGGEIMVNGEKVDAMLLNGKDFFDSDRELLLDNMPAYMVQNVQSYKRAPKDVQGTRREQMEKKELVMDIKLKKEYNASWMANVSGGLGEPLRWAKSAVDEFKQDVMYTGRAFGLYYDDRKRAMLYLNANNLNDDRAPGQDGEWSPFTQSQGLTNAIKGGGNYQYEFNEGTVISGNLDATYSDRNDANHSNSETFLEGGNTYGMGLNSNHSYDFDFRTVHSFYSRNIESGEGRLKDWYLHFSPNLSYQKWNRNGESASATLAQDVKEQLGKDWMDSLRSRNAGELLKKYAINRTLSNTKGEGHNLNFSANGSFNASPAHNDFLSFSGNVSYSYNNQDNDDYEHYQLDYPNNPSMKTDLRNQYTPSFDISQNVRGGVGVNFTINPELGDSANRFHEVRVGYSFEYGYRKSNQKLYYLQKLKDWDDFEAHPLGTLPSVEDMLRTLDADNSTFSRSQDYTHSPNINYNFLAMKEENGHQNYTSVSVGVNLPVKNENLRYVRGAQADTTISRNTVFLQPHISLYHTKNGFDMNMYYSMDTRAQSMTNLIMVQDTVNPLFKTYTNPDLKNTTSHYVNAWIGKRLKRTQLNCGVNANITQNAVAQGSVYHKKTGVRESRPENVNGNWGAGGNLGVNVAFDQDEKWRLNDNASYNYNNSVDLTSVSNNDEEVSEARKSIVGSHRVDNNLSLTWTPSSKVELSAHGNFGYQIQQSDREDFQTINVFDFDYALMAQLKLPLGFEVSTDITMYSRRGYNDNTMNTNELVWNARVTKKFMKGNLLVQLDGFDLLGKLSNVQRTINAQGRTEIYYNVIPSYCLAHFVYRFNKKPKAK